MNIQEKEAFEIIKNVGIGVLHEQLVRSGSIFKEDALAEIMEMKVSEVLNDKITRLHYWETLTDQLKTTKNISFNMEIFKKREIKKMTIKEVFKAIEKNIS